MKFKSRCKEIEQNRGNYMFQSAEGKPHNEERKENEIVSIYKQCELFYLQIKIGIPI
jgi:hypothetical protein